MKNTNDISENNYKGLRAYLLKQRTCSAQNLATKFDITLNQLSIICDKLVSHKYIRVAKRKCSNSCLQCDSCQPSGLLSTSIIISCEKQEG